MDGVRGLAVLIVFLSHSSGRGEALAPFLQFQGIGHIGVYLFFVLSGYLLADHLFHEYGVNGNVSVKNFLIRRCCRIMPLYYFVLTLLILYQEITGRLNKQYLHIDGGWVGYLQHLLFYKGDGLFWTLPTEFMFYFLLPFAVILIVHFGSKAITWMMGVATLYFIWFVLITLQIIPPNYALKLVHISHHSQFLDVFLCGVFAAWLSRTKAYKNLVFNNGHQIDMAGTVLLGAVLAASVILVSYDFLGFDRPMYAFRWLSFPIGLAFGFTIMAINVGGKLDAFFKLGLLRFMGIVGFSWYLIHFLVFQIINSIVIQPSIRFVLSFVLCAMFSTILFALIEAPFIQLGKRLTKR